MNTHKLLPQSGELLSALADAELRREEWQSLMQACDLDPSASSSWNTYHVIGTVLRSPSSTVQFADSAFLASLNQRLEKEPLPGTRAPVPTSHSGLDSPRTPIMAAGDRRGPASNDANFRWKMVAGLACAAAVSAIAWGVSVVTMPVAGPELAQLGVSAGGAAPQQLVVASPQGPIVRDARFEEFLAAHKQLGARSALSVPSGFLRNATFETQQTLGR